MKPSLELQNILKTQKIALLVIDMQKDFIDEDGKLAQCGQDVSAMGLTVTPINKLIEKAHQKKIPVIFTKMIDALKYRSEVGIYRFQQKEKVEENICVLENTSGSEFSKILPQEQDSVVIKHSYDSFNGTELKSLLDEKEIKVLIITGVKTNVCVETTVRNAYHLGYYVIVPQECVASDDLAAHQQTLKNFQRYFADVIELKDILEIL